MQPEQTHLSFLREGRALEDHDYALINRTESYEVMVGRLVTSVGLLDQQSLDTSVDTLARIRTAANQYKEHFWHFDNGRPVAKDIEAHDELYDQTEAFEEDVPLLREALKLQAELGRHNDAVLSAVYVVRLLVLQELVGQPQKEIPESA